MNRRYIFLIQKKLISCSIVDGFIFFFYYLMALYNELQHNIFFASVKYCQINRVSKNNFLRTLSGKKIIQFVGKAKQGNNIILESFLKSKECYDLRKKYEPQPSIFRDLQYQFIIQVKKPCLPSGEKGVLFLGYTERFLDYLACRDITADLNNYYIVLEPSWSGYCVPNILMFISCRREVLVQCPEAKDFHFIESLKSNLVPVKIGASHWVDLEVFRPLENVEKKYDVVYLASWAPFKRHDRLFTAIKEIKREKKSIKILLVGFNWMGRTKKEIVKEIEQHGIGDCITVVEKVPPQEVNLLLNQSRVSILLSQKEGSCRAIAESIAAGTPVLVYRNNEGGALNFVNEQTGVLSGYDELPGLLLRMKERQHQFKPREWAENNIGYFKATQEINKAIKRIALERGEPWTCDIIPKANAPNFCLRDPKEKVPIS